MRDVARKLIEARREREGVPPLPTTSERRDHTIVVAACDLPEGALRAILRQAGLEVDGFLAA